MSITNSQQLESLASQLREKRAEDVTFTDIVRLAEISTEAMQSFFAALDSAVLREIRDIADYITSMKREIGALQVNDIKNAHIPVAGQELKAVVQATESATNTIMECAEILMAADASDPKAYKALVDDKMMVMFEACSFQDITGQRIAKVVETLERIEARVSRFASAVRAVDIMGPLNEFEARAAERKSKLMLNGPSSGADSIGQNQVDDLMGKAPAKAAAANPASSQSEIDRLFS